MMIKRRNDPFIRKYSLSLRKHSKIIFEGRTLSWTRIEKKTQESDEKSKLFSV
jgi:hypothetical protein